MEILVYMDDEDKNRWFEVSEEYNAAIVQTRNCREPQTLKQMKKNLQKTTQSFWHDMIEKYGVLRNKQLNVDAVNGTISCWTSVSELRK